MNTSHGYGPFYTEVGFPFEYTIMNPPQKTIGVHLGNQYIDSNIAHTERWRWLEGGKESRFNARTMAVNLIEEVLLADPTDGSRRREQIRIFLQDNFGTVDALNKHIGSDISSWDELSFALQAGTNRDAIAFIPRWFYYDYRDSILNMRGDWLREGNPYLHIEPGMGASGPF